jgi:SAM-dependent methyltransferase
MRVRQQENLTGDGNCWSGGACAERYDVGANRAFYRATLLHVLENAPPLVGRGLDLGCGTGFSTEGLLEVAPQVTWTGVDCSREMVDRARRKPELGQVDLREARAEALPFADASLDVVVANFSWHWFSEGAGQEVRRVLRPGGWLLASVPLRRFSRAPGNRALAQALLAGRSHFARSLSQGLRFEDVRTLLPGSVRVARHTLVVVKEQFADGQKLRQVLESRGALAAIFGDHPPLAIEAPSPVDFEWPFAVLHTQV